MRVRAGLVAALVAASVASGCNDDGRDLRPASPDQNDSISVPETVAPDATAEAALDTPAPVVASVSAPFADGGTIDAASTCAGANLSPALTWTPAPPGTVETAVSMVDVDAGGFVHWVMSGIDPGRTSLAEGEALTDAVTSVNDAGTEGYSGPCPPAGETHTYVLTVHHLGQQTELGPGAPGRDLLAFVQGASIASASVTGTFGQDGG